MTNVTTELALEYILVWRVGIGDGALDTDNESPTQFGIGEFHITYHLLFWASGEEEEEPETAYPMSMACWQDVKLHMLCP